MKYLFLIFLADFFLFEMNLLQIMGTPTSGILKILSIQFVVLISGAVLSGVLLGLAMAWLLINYFFKISAFALTLTILFALMPQTN